MCGLGRIKACNLVIQRTGKDPPLINEKEKLVITDMEKAEVLSKFFDSNILGSQALLKSLSL